MILAWASPFKQNMNQIHEAVQALERILAAILDSVEDKKRTKKFSQGQHAYCKYLEIIQNEQN